MRYSCLKRFFDIALAGLGLLLLAPLGLLIGLLIKLTGPGPVFYGQTRIGQFGTPFRIWKFRTMIVNADQLGLPLTGGADPRVTMVGRWLRKTKLDELPQLWNVLAGQMSLVGPRPEVPRFVDHYNAEQRAILQYKPGVTDLASLLFRNEEELLRGATNLEDFYLSYCMPRKLALNRQYAERACLSKDLWILMRTLLPYSAGVLLLYAVCLSGSLDLAYLFKAGSALNQSGWQDIIRLLPWMVIAQLLCLAWAGQLRGLLSYFSMPELRKTIAALGAAFALQAMWRLFDVWSLMPSMSVLFLDFLFSVTAICGLRVALRLAREQTTRHHSGSGTPARRVALIGTGELGTNLLLNFVRSERPIRRVVAFFDDEPRTWHRRPHDVPVIGMPECLLSQQWQKQLDEVIIALPPERAERIQQLCRMLQPLPLKVTVASGWPELEAVERWVSADVRPA